MAVLENAPEGKNDTAVVGRLTPCPRCGVATGVPLPPDSTRVETADEADGSSPTRCPDCDAQFEVHYALD